MTIILEQEVPQSTSESYTGIKNIIRHKIYKCDTAYVDLVVYKDKYYIVATYFDTFDDRRKSLIIHGDTSYIVELYTKIVSDNKIELGLRSVTVKWEEYEPRFSNRLLDRFNREHGVE